MGTWRTWQQLSLLPWLDNNKPLHCIFKSLWPHYFFCMKSMHTTLYIKDLALEIEQWHAEGTMKDRKYSIQWGNIRILLWILLFLEYKCMNYLRLWSTECNRNEIFTCYSGTEFGNMFKWIWQYHNFPICYVI